MSISYTRQFAGAVYNPSIVVFRILRRTDRFPLRIAFIYIIVQFLGALSGGFIGRILTYHSLRGEQCFGCPHNNHPSYWPSIQETGKLDHRRFCNGFHGAVNYRKTHDIHRPQSWILCGFASLLPDSADVQRFWKLFEPCLWAHFSTNLLHF